MQHNCVGTRLLLKDGEGGGHCYPFANDTEMVLQEIDSVCDFVKLVNIYARASGGAAASGGQPLLYRIAAWYEGGVFCKCPELDRLHVL